MKKSVKLISLIVAILLLVGVTSAFAKGSFGFGKIGKFGFKDFNIVSKHVYKNNDNLKLKIDLRDKLDMLNITAQALNMTKEEFLKARQSGKTISDLLKEKNISEDTFKSNLKKLRDAAIDKLVSEGKLTKEQAQTLKQKDIIIKDFNRDTVNGNVYKMHEGPFGISVQIDVNTIFANALGITKDNLFQTLKNGKTLNDLLKEKNISLDTFKNKVLSAYNKEVDNLLTNGKITKAQADTLKQKFQNFINNFDPTKIPPQNFNNRFFKGHMRGHFDFNMKNNTNSTSSTTNQF
ncbi:hypothetical protein ACAG39_06330 [Caldicellulosiruptoraceae bacterium PP1]